MKKILLLFYSVVLMSSFISCGHYKEEKKREYFVINVQEFAERKVQLKNNLGELTVNLPIWFDTLFWAGEDYYVHFSNDTCNEYETLVCGNKKMDIYGGSCLLIPPIYKFDVS